jgi:peptidoglycan hydrolase-like protein with peptidoglycan-binding domain
MRANDRRSSATAGVASEGISPGKVSRSGRIARKAAGSAGDVEGALDRVSGSTGAGLPQAQRAQFEHSLGADLSAVRVHTGEASASAASELGARAFATGNDVHFGAGEYQPGDPFGLHLLAHEVAHTVQQGGAAGAQAKREVSEPGDPLEREADAAADAMVRGAPAAVTVGAPGAIGRVHRFGFGELSGEPAPAASMPLGEVQPTAPASTPGGGGGGSLGDATLAVGSSGAAVEELQRLLTAAGHACTVDGRFGPGTRAAVVAFQRAHGLVADGVVGAKTRAALASGGAAAGAAVAGPAVDPVAGPVPAGPSAGPVPAGPAATPAEAPPEHAADKAIANPVRQAIVMAARSKLGTVESNTPGEPDATGDKTRKGWETLTEIFEVAYPEFPKQIIKYIKWGKNSESTNGLVSWCGIFATWAVITGGGTCGTWKSGDRCSSMKRITNNPQPGDVGYFHAYQHHCIIAAVDGDRIETIDGNAYDSNSGGSGAITSRWRSRSDFAGFFKQVED